MPSQKVPAFLPGGLPGASGVPALGYTFDLKGFAPDFCLIASGSAAGRANSQGLIV
jgi:hypothetical protein